MGLAVHDERLTLRVGTTTLALVAALVAGMLALGRCELRPRFTATVYFAHTGPLREGAEVQVASQVIGKVTDISLLPAYRITDPAHPLYGTGGVAVQLRIEKRRAHMAPVNGEYFLGAKGLIGEAFVEIARPPDGAPPGRPLQQGDAVRGVDAPQLDRALWRSYASLKQSQALLAELAPEAARLGQSMAALGTTLDGLDAAVPGEGMAPWRALVAEAQGVAETWSGGELRWQDVSAVAAQARRTVDRARALLAEMEQRVQVLSAALDSVRGRVPDGLGDRLAAALAQAEASLDRVGGIVANVEALMAGIEHGQGTIGALLGDPEFSDDAKQLGKLIKRQPWRVIAPPPRQ